MAHVLEVGKAPRNPPPDESYFTLQPLRVLLHLHMSPGLVPTLVRIIEIVTEAPKTGTRTDIHTIG